MRRRKLALHVAHPVEERTLCGRGLDQKVIINGLPTCSVCRKLARRIIVPPPPPEERAA